MSLSLDNLKVCLHGVFPVIRGRKTKGGFRSFARGLEDEGSREIGFPGPSFVNVEAQEQLEVVVG